MSLVTVTRFYETREGVALAAELPGWLTDEQIAQINGDGGRPPSGPRVYRLPADLGRCVVAIASTSEGVGLRGMTRQEQLAGAMEVVRVARQLLDKTMSDPQTPVAIATGDAVAGAMEVSLAGHYPTTDFSSNRALRIPTTLLAPLISGPAAPSAPGV